jgi:putative ATP-dependent endonuclease of OLD family
MYLSKLKLWNFRKFGSSDEIFVEKKLRKPDLNIVFTKGLNVLIGENDSGKTAIIDAIKIILKTHSYEWIRLDLEDFHNDADKLRIECRFDNLSLEEAKNFTEWLGIEGKGQNAKTYLKVTLEAHKKDDRIFPFDIKAGVDDEGYPLTAEAKEYLKTTYLRPLRDAKKELVPKKNSRLSQILQGHEVFKGKNDSHELVENVFKNFCEGVESYFKTGNGGEKVKTDLDNFLKQFFGKNQESSFKITEQKLKNILETLKLTLEDGKLGLGSHNLLFIASELLNLDRKDWDGVRLGLIEELEAHLHPQAQMRVINSLQSQDNIQFILTTHSPNLASKVKLENLILCADDTENRGNVFPMGNSYTELDSTDYKFLERFLDVTKSNLFFAKGVILVEGWAEEILLPVFAKKIGINLTEKGISIVNVGSTAFLRYLKIFKRKNKPFINIPVSVITDNDICPEMEVKNKNKQENKNKNLKQNEEQSVRVFMGENWTLEWVLFQSSSISEKFKAVVRDIHLKTAEFQNNEKFAEKLKIKLKDKSLKKTEIAYQLAQILEDDFKKNSPEITIDEADEDLKYLIDAIKYATNGN